MPGPITNDWCIIGPESNDVESEETTGGAVANEALVLNDASDGLVMRGGSTLGRIDRFPMD